MTHQQHMLGLGLLQKSLYGPQMPCGVRSSNQSILLFFVSGKNFCSLSRPSVGDCHQLLYSSSFLLMPQGLALDLIAAIGRQLSIAVRRSSLGIAMAQYQQFQVSYLSLSDSLSPSVNEGTSPSSISSASSTSTNSASSTCSGERTS